jgi:hypothetical protein
VDHRQYSAASRAEKLDLASLVWMKEARHAPVQRGEFDLLICVAAHRSTNLTDAIESLPSGLYRPKHAA